MTNILVNFQKAGDEVVIGALREIGGAAVNFLGEAAGMALDFAKDAFTGALEAQAGIDKLNASIVRLGEDSPITAAQAQELADKFKNLAGGSDDAILSAENVLLRFDKIGSEVFPDVIQASADLAAAMGMDLNAAATIVGKTLQDLSTDGTASLGRLKAAGVVLTEAQEEQIKKMVELGDTAGAQRLLLDLLAETTGGAAAAAAETLSGKWAIFQETIADAAEGIALELLPILDSLFSEYIAPLIPQIETLAGVLADNVPGAIAGAQKAFMDFLPAIQPIIDAALNLYNAFIQSMPQIQAAVQVAFEFINGLVAQIMPTIVANVSTALNELAAFWQAHGAEIMAVITIAFEFIATTIGGALTLISGIIAAAMTALNGDWAGAWQIIQDTVSTFMESVLSLVGTNLDEFLATWQANWDMLVLIVQTVAANILSGVAAFLAQLAVDISQGILNAIAGAQALVQGFVDLGAALMEGLKQGIVNAAQGVIDAATGAVDDAIQGAKNLLGIHSPSTVFAGIGQNMMLGMAQGIDRNALAPAGAMAGATNTVINAGGITINGAGHPQAVAAAVRDELARMGRSADSRIRTR